MPRKVRVERAKYLVHVGPSASVSNTVVAQRWQTISMGVYCHVIIK